VATYFEPALILHRTYFSQGFLSKIAAFGNHGLSTSPDPNRAAG